jgi:hypothetical protein
MTTEQVFETYHMMFKDLGGEREGKRGEGQFPSQCFCKEKKNDKKKTLKYLWGGGE